jgi:hypothetical protein
VSWFLRTAATSCLPPSAGKKGAVNTPSESHFFENENGGFDFRFQNRRFLMVFMA